jgi:hypothetical protein
VHQGGVEALTKLRKQLLVAVIALVVAAALLVALDIAATRIAEERAEARVSEELDAPVDVTLHGWPTGLRLLTGQVERAEVTARDVYLEESGATLDRLDVTLHDIDMGWDDVMNPPEDLPPASGGNFEARLSGDATWALAAVPGGLASLDIADGGIRLRTLLGQASADIVVVGGQVQLIPRTALGIFLSFPVTIDISDQPGSPTIEEAWVDGDTLILRGPLQDVDATNG